MQFQLHKRAGRLQAIAPSFAQIGDKIIASAVWPTQADQPAERYMVFTVRNSKIVDMQGFTSRRAATKFAKS